MRCLCRLFGAFRVRLIHYQHLVHNLGYPAWAGKTLSSGEWLKRQKPGLAVLVFSRGVFQFSLAMGFEYCLIDRYVESASWGSSVSRYDLGTEAKNNLARPSVRSQIILPIFFFYFPLGVPFPFPVCPHTCLSFYRIWLWGSSHSNSPSVILSVGS